LLTYLVVIKSVHVRESEGWDLIEDRRTDIIWYDISAKIQVLEPLSGLVFEGQPRPIDKLILLKLVVQVLESEVGLDGVIIGQDKVLGTGCIFFGDLTT